LSTELIAILVTAFLQSVGIVILGFMLYRMRTKMDADDAAIFLQGRRIEEVTKEMRASLAR
jgi:hypothetical protein